MEYKHRIVFRNDEAKKLIKFIRENNVEHENDLSTSLIVLEMLESDEFWLVIKNYLAEYNISSYIEGVYSKEEMGTAEWFTIRSKWRWEYPQPEDDFRYEKNITYSNLNYCEQCGSGLVQIDSFILRKSPNWKKRNFLMLNWIEDELFLSDSCKKILLDSNLKGFEFLDVKRLKTKEKLDDISQLIVKNTLSPGLMNQSESIKQIELCSKCGTAKLVTTGYQFEYKKSIFPNNVDIIKSFESFGCGKSSSKIIFINQRFYQIIINNGLDRNLEIEPIKLV